MAYVNLPGTFANLVDGNLRQYFPNTDPLTLIIGTATTGFTGELFSVDDISTTLNEFGVDSELARGIVEARDGGARNMIALRLPGIAPVLTEIGAENSLQALATSGFTIAPVLASTEASTRYAMAYQHVQNYSDAGLLSDSSRLTGKLCIIDVESQETVWYGDVATGRAIIDAGVIDVDFGTIDPGVNVGVGTAEDIALTVGAGAVLAGDFTFRFSGKEFTLVMAGGETQVAVEGLIANAILTGFANVFTPTTVSPAITVTADGATLDADGTLVYAAGTYAGLAARPVLEWVDAGTTGITLDQTSFTNNGEALNIGYMPLDPAYPFARFGAGEFVALASVPATYDAAYLQMPVAVSEAAITTGDTGESLTLMERYEKMYEIFEVLDFKEFDLVLPQGVQIDAANIGEGSSITYLPANPTDYPLVGSTQDVLGKVAIVEDKANYTQTFYWDLDNDGIAELSSDGVLSADALVVGGLSYHEVNFAHQLAVFCYNSSENFQFCHGVIGTSTPRSLSDRGIKEFFGYLPTYTYDQGVKSYVVDSAADNGQGLLGHRMIGGRYGYHMDIAGGGLPLTLDGFLDTANTDTNIAKDVNGEVVDLGKYISVVGGFGHLRNEMTDAASGYLANLANVYSGLISSLPENVSTTNQTLSSVSIRYFLPATVADEAAGARIIAIVERNGRTKITDGPTFALTTSDYARLTTMRIVARLVEQVRNTTEPFLGKGMSTARRLAHKTAIEKIIQTNITEEMIERGNFNVRQTRLQKVDGKMDIDLTLTPVFELRQVNLTVALSAGV